MSPLKMDSLVVVLETPVEFFAKTVDNNEFEYETQDQENGFGQNESTNHESSEDNKLQDESVIVLSDDESDRIGNDNNNSFVAVRT